MPTPVHSNYSYHVSSSYICKATSCKATCCDAKRRNATRRKCNVLRRETPVPAPKDSELSFIGLPRSFAGRTVSDEALGVVV